MLSDLSNIVAVILAGGYGTRVRHLLPDVPKPMAPVAGRPFLEWVTQYLAGQGITRAVLSTGYLAEIVEQYFQPQPVPKIQIACCRETAPLGTAGGFLNVVQQVTSPPDAWLVLNGDSLVFADFAHITSHLTDPTISGVIVGLEVADTSRYGSLVCDNQGNLIRFAEKRPGAGVINAGVYLLRHTVVQAFSDCLPLSFETEVFPALLAQGIRLHVRTVKVPFLDIGTPETLAQAESFILNNLDRFTSS